MPDQPPRRRAPLIWAHGRVHEWEGRRPVRLLGFVVDLTERKREAEALHESEERFRRLVEASTSIVWTADSDGVLDARSASWEAFTGQRPGEYLRPGWGWLDAVHPDDRAETHALWAEAIRGREAIRAGYRLRRADGSYRRVTVSAAPLVGPDGAVAGWIGSNTNVEEARQAADEIEKLVRVVEASGDLVGMADLDGNTIYVNPAGLELLGLDGLEARGIPMADYCMPDGLELLQSRVLPDVMSGQTAQVEWTLRHQQTGEPIETEAIVFLVRGPAAGQPLAIATVQRDIRVRKRREAERAELLARAEEARSEAERRAHATAAFTFVSDGVVLVDGNGLVRSWNPAAERITGIGQEAALGRAIEESLTGWTDIAARIPLSASGDRAPAGAHELPLQLVDRELWLSISGTAFEGGTVFTFRDVTAGRALDRIRTDLIATISHELRTPLAAVYGAAMTLQRRDIELDRPGRAPFLAMIETNAQGLAAIVDEILLAGKLEAGSLPIAIEAPDAVEAARSAVAGHFVNRHTIELIAPPVAPLVAADPGRLRQVLANLIDNAIKYSGDGSSVVVAVELGAATVRYTVCDSGVGIAPDQFEHVFQKFYRVDVNMSSGVGGTGLGLYICRELVRNMGGRIWVDSRLGEGSTFHVELPLARA